MTGTTKNANGQLYQAFRAFLGMTLGQSGKLWGHISAIGLRKIFFDPQTEFEVKGAAMHCECLYKFEILKQMIYRVYALETFKLLVSAEI